jgi:hypothetical protein
MYFYFILLGLIIYLYNNKYINIILLLFYYRFLEIPLFNNILIENENEIIISYVYNWNIYKMKLKKCENNSPIILIIDENKNIITKKIRPYIGPYYNFNNIIYKTIDFNKKYLEIHFLNGNILKTNNDIII